MEWTAIQRPLQIQPRFLVTYEIGRIYLRLQLKSSRFFLSTTNLIKIAPKVHFPEKRLNGSDFLFWWGTCIKQAHFRRVSDVFLLPLGHSFENRQKKVCGVFELFRIKLVLELPAKQKICVACKSISLYKICKRVT